MLVYQRVKIAGYQPLPVPVIFHGRPRAGLSHDLVAIHGPAVCHRQSYIFLGILGIIHHHPLYEAFRIRMSWHHGMMMMMPHESHDTRGKSHWRCAAKHNKFQVYCQYLLMEAGLEADLGSKVSEQEEPTEDLLDFVGYLQRCHQDDFLEASVSGSGSRSGPRISCQWCGMWM